jgi:Alr-MurF fusion protein
MGKIFSVQVQHSKMYSIANRQFNFLFLIPRKMSKKNINTKKPYNNVTQNLPIFTSEIYSVDYPLQHIAEILSIHNCPSQAVIDTLLIDSRKIVSPATSLFFALEGPRRNGHIFIPELYKRGIRFFVISKSIEESQYPEAVFLHVKDTLAALQELAAFHRTLFDIEVIGVTGSNGKTIVKEWLYQLLKNDRNIVRSPKSYNSQIGVPLSVWQMEEQNNLAIFEAGISLPNEMEQLEKIIRPTIGVLTNLGSAHSEGFENDEQKICEKLKLFSHSKIVLANGDVDLIRKNIESLALPLFSWGVKKENNVRVAAVHKGKTFTSIQYIFSGTTFSIEIPFTDDASVENAITCCAILLYLKTDPAIIASRMKTLQRVNMRLEFNTGINNCTLINDSYSADVNSLSIALDFLKQQSQGKKKTVILSDFPDNRQDGISFYSAIVAQLQEYGISKMIGIGQKMQKLLPKIFAKKDYGITYETYFSTQDFIRHFNSSGFREEVILIKGARAFELENVAALLEQKVHQTILEINMDAIAHNLKAFQQRLNPSTKIMVMVKAFAYGSGGAEVAGVLQYHKADYLGVAYADEGVELRQAGISLPILVLNSEENAFDAITDNNLEPDIFSFEILNSFQKHLQQNGLKNYPVHIEIETGMNRLGFNVNDIEQLGNLLRNNEYVKVVSAFSHLVASEDAAEDTFSLHQYQLLKDTAARLKSILGYDFLKHLANSSGILRFPQMQMDMVRLGIGLYGIAGNETLYGLKQVLTLKTTVAQVKLIKKGETVSYNRRGMVKEDSMIATVRIGYADGYSRRFGNGTGKMLVNGHLAPVIGSVCMDMTMLNVTQIPGVKEGDEVIVFGEKLPVQQLAESIGTIPYEMMTCVSQRVKRVYWSE